MIVIAIVTSIENLLCARQKYRHTHTHILFILAKIPWEKHFFTDDETEGECGRISD